MWSSSFLPHRWTLAVAISLALLGGSNVFAATSPVKGTTTAKASVTNSCVLSSVSALSFGSYNPLSASPNTATGQLQMICTKGVTYSINANTGQHNGTMLGVNGDALTYAVFSDSGYSKQLGNWNNSTQGVSSQGYCFSQKIATVPTTAQINSVGIAPIYAYVADFSSYYYGYMGPIPVSGTCPVGAILKFSGASGPTYYGTAPSSPGAQYVVDLSGSIPVTGTSASAKSTIVVPYYGRVPGSQNVRPSSYSDMVTLTISF